MAKRNREIDVLRGIAILLVLARHSDYGTIFYKAGWLGVDLFFLLSGFLISSLLFKSYKETGTIRPGRFLVRRSFKIYPSFYIYLLVSMLVGHFLFGIHFSNKAILSEVFFVQNIWGGANFHTWSIGIEEQFYLVVALGFYILAKAGWLTKPVFPWLLCMLMITAALIRLYLGLTVSEPFAVTDYFYLRTDALVMGVLLAYILYYREWTGWARPVYKIPVLVLTSLLLIPFFTVNENLRAMYQYGFTATYLGFAGLFVLLVYIFPTASLFRWKAVDYIFGPLAFVGRISYNIYLWHLFCGLLIEKLIQPSDKLTYTILYIPLSLGMGYLATLCIEKPFLKWREKWVKN